MKIKLFCMDVDGTLTDGAIHVGPEGELFRSFNVKDGYGIKKLIERGIIPVIITSGESQINLIRFEYLGINEIYQGITEKVGILHNLTLKYNCMLSEIAFIGDDDNDIGCVEEAGISACPSDGSNSMKERVDYVCGKHGGYGAVREFIDLILKID
jgi:3-deoxy-D-manno-octulosonate 8-phosphate phosphatase (KDO 8-P phosphatase)